MKTYIVQFQTPYSIDTITIEAKSIAEAKRYANAYKRRNLKGQVKTTVRVNR